MKIDATCTDAEVRYPTDMYLFENASLVVNRLIDKISSKTHLSKFKTNRTIAGIWFVKFIKQKHKGNKFRRSTTQHLLHYLSQDMQSLLDVTRRVSSEILRCLNRKDLRDMKAIRTMYTQQKETFDEKKRSCANRIKSIFQSHVPR